MGKRLTYEFVKSKFEEEGYELLSGEYINSKTKLKYRCPKGHEHQIGFSEWKKGQRCPHCIHDSFRHRYNYVKECIESEGYTLVSKEYVNNRSKLNLICPKGHSTSMTFGNWRIGFRCKYCAKNVKFTLDFVRGQFEKEDYVLLSPTYINQKQKLKYKCPYGHKHEITFTDWYNGEYRCPTCYAVKMFGPGNHEWRGGVSNGPYCSIWKDQEFKQDIRDRDGNKCLNPSCYSNNPDDLTIHHIDYVKTNCEPKNLITVCRACNNRANKERNWHRAWYRAIMFKRYNYKY
jgi:hypothetical protein